MLCCHPPQQNAHVYLTLVVAATLVISLYLSEEENLQKVQFMMNLMHSMIILIVIIIARLIHMHVCWQIPSTKLVQHEGRVFLHALNGTPISFWHDLPWKIGNKYTFVNEIPKKWVMYYEFILNIHHCNCAVLWFWCSQWTEDVMMIHVW